MNLGKGQYINNIQEIILFISFLFLTYILENAYLSNLTYFWSIFPFYTLWKYQKTFGFLVQEV